MLPAAPRRVAQEPECAWMITSKSARSGQNCCCRVNVRPEDPLAVRAARNNPTQTTSRWCCLHRRTVPCTPSHSVYDGRPPFRARRAASPHSGPGRAGRDLGQDPQPRKGKAQGYEAFHKHRNVPPRPRLASGRCTMSRPHSEYLGEDPLLRCHGRAMVRGIQRTIPMNRSRPSSKHYVAK